MSMYVTMTSVRIQKIGGHPESKSIHAGPAEWDVQAQIEQPLSKGLQPFVLLITGQIRCIAFINKAVAAVYLP